MEHRLKGAIYNQLVYSASCTLLGYMDGYFVTALPKTQIKQKLHCL